MRSPRSLMAATSVAAISKAPVSRCLSTINKPRRSLGESQSARVGRVLNYFGEPFWASLRMLSVPSPRVEM